MALKESLENWYAEEKYPPDGPELGEGVTQVSYGRLGSVRWGEYIQVIYTDGNEFWAVRDIEPATEYQSWGDYGTPEIYQVEPFTVTSVKYRKVP